MELCTIEENLGHNFFIIKIIMLYVPIMIKFYPKYSQDYINSKLLMLTRLFFSIQPIKVLKESTTDIRNLYGTKTDV